MDSHLYQTIKDSVPKFNPHIAEGVAVKQLELAEQFVDRVFQCAVPQFPEGLKYHGYSQCTPTEEWKEVIKPLYGKHTFEISRSDVYLVKYQFSWQGKMLPPRYLYLPFVGQAGTMHLRGPIYTVSPVMADIALSVAKNGIFVPFLRDKVTFSRFPFSFIKDGIIENCYIAWSAIHRYAADNSKKVGVTSILPHYLFCKYGVTETFKRFYDVDVVIGEEEIDIKNYPPNKWIICKGVDVPPKGLVHRPGRHARMRLAIPIKQYKPELASLIGGFFYVVGYFPHRFKAEYCDSIRFWRILMGHVIFKSDVSEGKLALDIDAHMSSLDDYVDGEVRESLAKSGVYCNDIYELSVYIQNNISDILMNADLSDNYNKKLIVLRYVLLDIIKAIFNLTYKLNSNTRKVLTEQDVIKLMGKYLNRNLIFGLSKQHGEINIISSPGDSTIFKFTSNVVPQADATSTRRSRNRVNLNDPAKMLHTSIIELGSIANLPKSEPTGRTRLNPYMITDSDGSIHRDPKKKVMLDQIQRLIQR